MEQELSVLFVEDRKDDVELMMLKLASANGFAIDPIQVYTEEGLRTALSSRHIDAIFCDYRMPDLAFDAALGVLDEFNLDIIFILVSGHIQDEELEAVMRRHDRIFAFVSKDQVGLIAAALRQAIKFYKRNDRMYRAWNRLMDKNNTETEAHVQRVAALAVELARRMGVERSRLINIYRGALLHDIGKVGIPDSILLKPGPLTEGEWVIMRKHPEYAYEVLYDEGGDNEYLRDALSIVRHHHEKWDGTGYPDGLKGENIPLFARLFAVVDVYDALTVDDRPYRRAWTKAEALKHLQDYAGVLFDGRAVRVFVKMMAGRN